MYDPICWMGSRDERQALLFNLYGILCECEKCGNNDWPISSNRVASDPEYGRLMAFLHIIGTKFEDDAWCMCVDRMCTDILSKYADSPWCSELDMVSSFLNDIWTTKKI